MPKWTSEALKDFGYEYDAIMIADDSQMVKLNAKHKLGLPKENSIVAKAHHLQKLDIEPISTPGEFVFRSVCDNRAGITRMGESALMPLFLSYISFINRSILLSRKE